MSEYRIGRDPVVLDANAVPNSRRGMPRMENPERTIQIRNDRTLARVCADTGLGEYHCSTKFTRGGWFLTPVEYGQVVAEFDRRRADIELEALERIRASKRRYNARTRAARKAAPPSESDTAFAPPSGAEDKARRSYQQLVDEWVGLGHALDNRARASLWARARAFYGLTAGHGSPPDVTPQTSHEEMLSAATMARQIGDLRDAEGLT